MTEAEQMWAPRRQTDEKVQVRTDRQTGGLNTVGERETEKSWERCSHVLTSALSISATIFIAILAPLLHTNSMGLVSASHTSEATIQSSRSPGQPCKHTLKVPEASVFHL